MTRLPVLFLMLATVSAAAQEVLVAEPPVYLEGEQSRGEFITQSGVYLELRQKVERWSDGDLYLNTTIVNEDLVIGGSVANLRTRELVGEKKDHDATPSENRCSPLGVFPIVRDKVYECVTKIKVGGRVVLGTSHKVYNHVVHNKQGARVAICAEMHDKNELWSHRSRVCFSPDARWIILIYVFDEQEYRRM